MNWFLAALLSAICAVYVALSQKSYRHKDVQHSVLTGAQYQVATGIWCLVIGIVSGRFALVYEPTSLLIAIVACLFYVISGYCYYVALQHMEISLLTIIGSSRVFVTLIAGYLIFHETLTITQLAGMGLILSAIILTQQVHRTVVAWRYVILVLGFVLIVGLSNIVDRFVTKDTNLYLYLAIGFALPGILTLIMGKARGITLQVKKSHLQHVIVNGFLHALSGILLVTAIATAPTTTQPVMISQSRILLLVVFAAFFLKERAHLKTKILAAIICVIGLFLIH